jgi:hypothetical protein
VDSSIDSYIFTGYERGVLERKHRGDDVRNFTQPGGEINSLPIFEE